VAKDPERADDLDDILYHLAEALRIIAILLTPVLPKACAQILDQLQVSGPQTLSKAVWGGIENAHVVGTPTPLFPKLESPLAPDAAGGTP
jgi:methionyl-tRNA synthetase